MAYHADGMTDDRIELGEATGTPIVHDQLPKLEDPPPVRLVAVEDVRLPTPPGTEAALDGFYVGLWQFRREADNEQIVYRAENVRLRFLVQEGTPPVERDGARPQGVIVPSLRDAERRLAEARIPFERQRALLLGLYTLIVQDPAGNWLELMELRKL
jgi:hypothetical protein